MFCSLDIKPPWRNGLVVGLLLQGLWVRVPPGVDISLFKNDSKSLLQVNLYFSYQTLMCFKSNSNDTEMITIPLWPRRCRTLWFAVLIEKVLRRKLPYSTGKLTALKLFRDSFDAHVNRYLKPEFGKGGKSHHGRNRAQIRDCPPNYNSLPSLL